MCRFVWKAEKRGCSGVSGCSSSAAGRGWGGDSGAGCSVLRVAGAQAMAVSGHWSC